MVLCPPPTGRLRTEATRRWQVPVSCHPHHAARWSPNHERKHWLWHVSQQMRAATFSTAKPRPPMMAIMWVATPASTHGQGQTSMEAEWCGTHWTQGKSHDTGKETGPPGPTCDLTRTRAASPILGKNCVSQWLLSTLEDASCCHPMRNSCSKSGGLGSGCRAPLIKACHERNSKPITPTEFLAAWATSATQGASVPHPTRARTHPGSLGGKSTQLAQLAPSCALHCANQDLPNRVEMFDLSNCLCALVQKHCHKLSSWCRANSMKKQQPCRLNVSHKRDALQQGNQDDPMGCPKSWHLLVCWDAKPSPHHNLRILSKTLHTIGPMSTLPHLGLACVNMDACVDPQLLLHGCVCWTNSGWKSGQTDVQKRQDSPSHMTDIAPPPSPWGILWTVPALSSHKYSDGDPWNDLTNGPGRHQLWWAPSTLIRERSNRNGGVWVQPGQTLKSVGHAFTPCFGGQRALERRNNPTHSPARVILTWRNRFFLIQKKQKKGHMCNKATKVKRSMLEMTWKDLLLIMTHVMSNEWWTTRTYTSESKECHVTLWSMCKATVFENQFRKFKTIQIDMLFNKIYDRINHTILSVKNQNKWCDSGWG